MIPTRSEHPTCTLAEDLVSRLVDSNLDATMVESVGHIVAVNEAFLRLHRYHRPGQLLGQPVDVLYDPGDRDRVLEIKKRRLLGQETTVIFEFKGKCRDGAVIELEGFLSVSFVKEETLLVTVVRDITEKRKAEQALWESEARLRAAVESFGEGLVITDPEDVVQFVNSRLLALTGFCAADLLGRRGFEVLLPRSEWKKLLRRNQMRLKGIHERYQTRFLRKDGSVFWAEVNAVPFRNVEGVIVGTLGIVTDITERKQDEERMKFQADVLSQVNEAIVAVDPDGMVSYWNHGAEELYGYRFYQALGRPLRELTGYDCLEAASKSEALAAFSNATAWREETMHRRKDGASLSVELSVSQLKDADGRPNGFLALIRDISERKRASEVLKQREEQLRQSQKMEAVGKLAGGVAHDFNNLLTAISGYSELILSRLDYSDPLRNDAEEIRRAGNRAAELTRQLLAFSRKQVLKSQVFDLNTVVLGIDRMLRRLIGAHIELVTVLDPELAPIKADRGQIEQVILNLAVNARDAMPNGGKLVLETRSVAVDFLASRKENASDPAGYVMLAVSDTGCGMDAETQAHIFEPFYTTKQQGEGTGLGLSTVYGIIQQSGGSIQVESELDRGSTFRVFLPQEPRPSDAMLSSRAEQQQTLGTETILLVEDETVVRNLVQQVLKRSGYVVLEAQHGAEALRLAMQHQGPIHLLLTDVVMPLMGGRDLAQRLNGLRKETKVLFMSGYTDDAAIRQGSLDPGTAFIQKPFTPDCLAQKVRAVLDSGDEAGG